MTLSRCSCILWGPLRHHALSQWSRAFAISCVRCQVSSGGGERSHYAALNITPAATQADVKAAYYNLTKIYHPDRSCVGSADANERLQKFREVTAAYEVLGNVKLRRLYDKGMHHIGSSSSGSPHTTSWRATEEANDPTLKFYRSRDVKSRPPPPTRNIPLYDFDEWSKQHYGATFARDQSILKNQRARQASESFKSTDVRAERVLVVMSVLVATLMFINADMSRHDRASYTRSDDGSGPATN